MVRFVKARKLALRQPRVAEQFLVIEARGLELAVLIFVLHTWSSLGRGSPFLKVQAGAQR